MNARLSAAVAISMLAVGASSLTACGSATNSAEQPKIQRNAGADGHFAVKQVTYKAESVSTGWGSQTVHTFTFSGTGPAGDTVKVRGVGSIRRNGAWGSPPEITVPIGNSGVFSGQYKEAADNLEFELTSSNKMIPIQMCSPIGVGKKQCADLKYPLGNP